MHDCDPPVWPAFLPFDCFPSPTLRGAGGIVQDKRGRLVAQRHFSATRAAQMSDLRINQHPERNRPATKSERSLNDGRPRFPMVSGVIVMSARVSSRRRWFLRDIPRTYVLFVWLAFGLAIFLYAYDWRPSGWSVLRQSRSGETQNTTPARSSSCRRAAITAGSE
jgi:hypothetical protein